jgi:hypothetical protein
MKLKRRDTSRRRGSILVYVSMALPLVILPLTGLAVDGSVAHIVQAKLQAAVDGASLGAGRLLGTNANLTEIAGEFLQANFRPGASGNFGAGRLTYTATYTPGVVKTITVSASVTVPTIFARVMGSPGYTVPATATATRKDTRVVMVIDRSGSMSAMISTLKNYAEGFAQKFNGSGVVGGADELGLVAFDGSAVVGYPSVRPWDPTTTATSTGGPNSSFKDGSATDIIHQISAITASNGTGMAEAIWLAYIELQKAHMRDLAAPGSLGVDQRMNAIVLFTDGVPSAVSLYLNNPSNNSMVQGASCKCSNKSVAAPVPASKQIKGWVAVPGPPYDGSGLVGLWDLLASTDPKAADTANWWMGHGGSDAARPNPLPNPDPQVNCTGLSGSNIYTAGKTDLAKIPSTDMYGNLMNTNGYTFSHIVDSKGAVSSIYNGTALDLTKNTLDYHWGLAIWNSVDNAAKNARTDSNFANRTGDTQIMPVSIHVIAYTANNGVDDGLLKRVANTTDSSSFNIAQPQGLYVPAGDSTALANAFNQVASSLLHLSK